MRTPALLLTAALIGLAVAPLPEQPASASCAAPYLEVDERTTLSPGTTVTIEGGAFVDGCRDVMVCGSGWGCDDGCEYPDPPPVPYEDVELRLVQGQRSWVLGTSDAGTAEDDQQGRVRWTVDLPTGAEPGRARLVADHAGPVQVRIR
jgi:hypothetical protein